MMIIIIVVMITTTLIILSKAIPLSGRCASPHCPEGDAAEAALTRRRTSAGLFVVCCVYALSLLSLS